jgi:hypothetical protein
MYPDEEQADTHLMYGLADSNAVVAYCLYQEKYLGQRCPDRKTFVNTQNFTPCVANRG